MTLDLYYVALGLGPGTLGVCVGRGSDFGPYAVIPAQAGIALALALVFAVAVARSCLYRE